MTVTKHTLAKSVASVAAVALLVVAMGGTWQTVNATPSLASAASSASSTSEGSNIAPGAKKSLHKQWGGKLNLNTASEDQLMLLPTVGPAKAERIVAWRKKNGSFKRIADLRRIKGFGYKTFKRLEPLLDIKGETTLAAK